MDWRSPDPFCDLCISLPCRIYPLHDSSQVLAMKVAAYNKEIHEVRQWYEKEHMNYAYINGAHSKWKSWNEAIDIAQTSVRQIQTYLQRVSDGKAFVCTQTFITIPYM